ncbi:MAG TPA: hypothetical protein DEW39_04500 [Brevibacterium sp.]|nr:hypothetical protein [Brevibacterium sp.]
MLDDYLSIQPMTLALQSCVSSARLTPRLCSGADAAMPAGNHFADYNPIMLLTCKDVVFTE